jgi:dihydroceramidase
MSSPPVIFDQPGFWGPVTASIDWCEPNYVVSYYVAEFWNTISNLGFIAFPMVWLYLGIRYQFERRLILACVATFMVGLGSALFHGTLLFMCQLGDELPMLWLTLVTLYSLIEKEPTNRYPWLPYAMSAFGAAWTLLAPWSHRHYPLAFQVVFISLEGICVYLVIPEIRKTTNRTTKLIFYVGFICSFIIAATCWLLDIYLCPMIKASTSISFNPIYIHVGSLHGYWHIFMSIHSYSAALFFTYLRLETLGRRPCYSFMRPIPILPCVRPRDKVRNA